jgi:hypothetical protein
MAEQHYTGGCQCGAVRYETDLDIGNTISCNCSRCGKVGSILAFTPQEKFKLLKGESSLTEYKFNKGVISHLFCNICGIQSFSRGTGPDGTRIAAINVRCLDGVDADALTPHKYNGAAV